MEQNLFSSIIGGDTKKIHTILSPLNQILGVKSTCLSSSFQVTKWFCNFQLNLYNIAISAFFPTKTLIVLSCPKLPSCNSNQSCPIEKGICMCWHLCFKASLHCQSFITFMIIQCNEKNAI
jgi:hypothetical protein